MFKLNRSLLVGSLMTVVLSGCGAVGGDAASESAHLGSQSQALKLALDSKHDVKTAKFVVVPKGGKCDDAPIAQTIGEIEDEPLQANLDPSKTATGRAFIDGLMVLPPGDYTVCVTPLQADGFPSAQCSQAVEDVTVKPEVTTEIVVVAQCEGNPNGLVDVVGALNDPPKVTGFNIGPSKFITTCQTAEISVTAEDPNGDPLTYHWEMVSGPDLNKASLIENGPKASFKPATAGDYELKVTVTDATGGTAHMSFPIHVSQAEGACEQPKDCPSGTYLAADHCWLVAPQEGLNGSETCAQYNLKGDPAIVDGLRLTTDVFNEVIAKLGCTNGGFLSEGTPSIYIDSPNKVCYWSDYTNGTVQDYTQAPLSWDTGDNLYTALHACARPQ